MGHYPFTFFNGVTVSVLALTLSLLWWRFRRPLNSNWPLAVYAAIVGYTIGFSGGLNPYWVAAAAVCALAIRFGPHPSVVKRVELLPIGYMMCRCVGLIMRW
jgi:hypothetical protein